MCGRYGFSIKDAREITERFETINTLDDFAPRWNIAPGQMNPVITKHSPNQIQRMFWGLIPSWAKDKNMKFSTINARMEGIESKPTYRKPLRMTRCLIPATFFYEWDKDQKPSQPYLFKLKNDEIFAFAGLYDIWKDPENEKELYSYTIITTSANELVGKIHQRMPVILNKKDEEEWLNPDITEPEKLLPLLKQFPSEKMESYPISRVINNPGSDTASIIEPIKNSE